VSVLRAYRGLLSNGPLVRLLSGEFVSSIGDWLYLVALLIVVYETSADPVLLGFVGAARILPYVALSIPAGMIADRYERRLVLLITDLARGAIMLVMACIVALDGPLWAIVALAILATCFSCFFGPTIGAYLPSLVRDERELGPANSAWSTLDNLAFVVGPAVGAILIGLSGIALAFFLNAASFAVIAVVLWRLPPEHRQAALPAANESSPPAAEVATEGEVAADLEAPAVPVGPTSPSVAAPVPLPRAPLAGLALIDTVSGFVFGGLGVLTVILATDQFGAGEAATGYLNAAVGVGGILGAIGSGAFVIRPALRGPLLVGSSTLAVGVAALGLVGGLGPALIAMAIASTGSLLTEVVSTTIFQRIVPDAIRGRALGTIATVSTLAYAAGSLVMPIAAGAFGIEPVLLASGALVVVGATVSVLLIGGGGTGGPSPDLVAAAGRIGELAVFAGVPQARLADAFSRAAAVDVAAGTVVIREGDPADRFYVIVDGTFDVDQATPDGGSRRLRTMGPDEVFGEIGLLTESPRSATVRAATDGRLLALDAPDFLGLVEAAADVGPRLLALHRGGATPG
jgi:Major Facilitator Superfamily/Cyclic nucleotide-binding domain